MFDAQAVCLCHLSLANVLYWHLMPKFRHFEWSIPARKDWRDYNKFCTEQMTWSKMTALCINTGRALILRIEEWGISLGTRSTQSFWEAQRSINTGPSVNITWFQATIWNWVQRDRKGSMSHVDARQKTDSLF